jgi:hypothetical protein
LAFFFGEKFAPTFALTDFPDGEIPSLNAVSMIIQTLA